MKHVLLCLLIVLVPVSLRAGTAEGDFLHSGVTKDAPTASSYATVTADKKMFLDSCEDQLNSVCRIEFQWEYEAVAASQTDQVMGAIGAAGDLLHALKCATSAASVGTVTVKDGAGSSFTIFLAQGAAAILDSPALDWVSVNGAWSVTTGTNTTCRVSGRFS